MDPLLICLFIGLAVVTAMWPHDDDNDPDAPA